MGKAVFAYAGVVMTYLLGSNPEALLGLVLIVVVDGLLAIAVSRDSRRPAEVPFGRFVVRKASYVGLIVIANLVDRGLGTDPPILATTAIWILIVAEAATCIRYLGLLGVPVPDNLLAAVELLRGRGQATVAAPVPREVEVEDDVQRH